MLVAYSYKKDKDKYVSPNFQVWEFASIDGNGHLYSDTVLIDTENVDILERLFNYLPCDMIKNNSGYRTNEHEMTLGNSVKNGYHVQGKAVDFNCYRNGKVLSSKEICLALEDLGWKHGIGIISERAVHIDSRTNKYYFNEMNGNKSIGNSFYTYYNVDKPSKKVLEKFGLAEETIDYLNEYKYSAELFKKFLTAKQVYNESNIYENVQKTFGLADETMKYLLQYLYGNELLEKLMNGVKNGK